MCSQQPRSISISPRFPLIQTTRKPRLHSTCLVMTCGCSCINGRCPARGEKNPIGAICRAMPMLAIIVSTFRRLGITMHFDALAFGRIRCPPRLRPPAPRRIRPPRRRLLWLRPPALRPLRRFRPPRRFCPCRRFRSFRLDPSWTYAPCRLAVSLQKWNLSWTKPCFAALGVGRIRHPQRLRSHRPLQRCNRTTRSKSTYKSSSNLTANSWEIRISWGALHLKYLFYYTIFYYLISP